MTTNLRDDTISTEIALITKENSDLHDLLQFYPEEQVERLLNNKDKLIKIAKQFNCNVPYISKSTMVMTCRTVTCPFRHMCVLNRNQLAPDGDPCPIEKKVINELETTIVEELDIDQNSTLEMELLFDLIDAKLLDMRTSGLIGEVGVVQTIEVRSGNVTSSSRDVAPEFKVKMDLKKLKFAIMEEFMATRKAKKKYGLAGNDKQFENLVRNAMLTRDAELTDADATDV